jgi:hypothetical protein
MKLRNSVIGLFLLVPSLVYGQATLSYGIRGDSILASSSCGTGTSFAVPTASSTGVTWTTKFSTSPATAATILIEGSLNNGDWYTLDTSTAVAGEIRSFATTALFIRAKCSSKTDGGNLTVSLVLNRAGSIAFINRSIVGTLTGNNVWTGTNTFTLPTGFADGTVLLPSIYNIGNEDTGVYWSAADTLNITTGGVAKAQFDINGLGLGPNSLMFGASVGSPDVFLKRGGANILDLVNGTTPQQFHVYNTLSGSNWERGVFDWLMNYLLVFM